MIAPIWSIRVMGGGGKCRGTLRRLTSFCSPSAWRIFFSDVPRVAFFLKPLTNAYLREFRYAQKKLHPKLESKEHLATRGYFQGERRFQFSNFQKLAFEARKESRFFYPCHGVDYTSPCHNFLPPPRSNSTPSHASDSTSPLCFESPKTA